MSLPRQHKIQKLLSFVYSKAPAMWRPRRDAMQPFLLEFMQSGMELCRKQGGTVKASSTFPHVSLLLAAKLVLSWIVTVIHRTHRVHQWTRLPKLAMRWVAFFADTVGGLKHPIVLDRQKSPSQHTIRPLGYRMGTCRELDFADHHGPDVAIRSVCRHAHGGVPVPVWATHWSFVRPPMRVPVHARQANLVRTFSPRCALLQWKWWWPSRKLRVQN
jgi:hypothetical protein